MSANTDEMFQVAGKIAALWANSTLHFDWNMKSFEKFVLPPVALRQYLLMQTDDGFPLAYVSWAQMTLEAEARYLDNPAHVEPGDWAGGDRIWIMDLVSPYGAQFQNALIRQLKNEVFPDKVARSVRVKKGRAISRVVRWAGVNVSSQRRRELFTSYLDSLRAISQSDNIIWNN